MVDTSLFEAGIVHTYWQSAICFATGVSPGPLGSGHPLSAPYQALPASDGWLTIGASNQSNWLRLVDAIGAPELSEDERFLDNGARMANLPELVEVLTAIFQQRSVAEWLEKLERAGRTRGTGAGHRADARGPADACPQDGGGRAASAPRSGENDRRAGEVLRYGGGDPATRAFAWRAHGRGPRRDRDRSRRERKACRRGRRDHGERLTGLRRSRQLLKGNTAGSQDMSTAIRAFQRSVGAALGLAFLAGAAPCSNPALTSAGAGIFLGIINYRAAARLRRREGATHWVRGGVLATDCQVPSRRSEQDRVRDLHG